MKTVATIILRTYAALRVLLALIVIWLSLLLAWGMVEVARADTRAGISTARAERADRNSVEHALQLSDRDVRIHCQRIRREEARCRDAARAIWIDGQPASWATWTDLVVQRQRTLMIEPGPAEIEVRL